MRRHRLATLALISTIALLPSQAHAVAPRGESTEPEPERDSASHRDASHDHGHDHDATARHRFDDVERWVERFDDPARDAWQQPDEVIRFLDPAPGDVVADIGAGTGYFSVRLAKAVGPDGRVLAVDVEPALVEHIANRASEAGLPQVEAVLAEADDPDLGSSAVDLVFLCNTWHHIDDRLSYLGRLESALRPGGRLAIVDFHEGELPVGPPPGHKLSREAVVRELDEAGWTLAAESETLPHQYVLVFTPPVD